MSSAPLSGKTIVITAATKSSPGTSNEKSISSGLELLGVKLILFPTIETSPLFENINNFLDSYSLEDFRWIFFTSKNGVIHFFNSVEKSKNRKNIRKALSKKKFAVIGNSTANCLKKYSYQVDFQPDESNANGLAREFLEFYSFSRSIKKGRFLFLLGNLASGQLIDELSSVAECHRVDVYQTSKPTAIENDKKRIIRDGKYDLLLFTSPSSFKNFVEIIGEKYLTKPLKAVSIGPTTSSAMIHLGFPPLFTADKPEIEIFIKNILNYFSQ
jgi:uroporphyrinogen-III synthase